MKTKYLNLENQGVEIGTALSVTEATVCPRLCAQKFAMLVASQIEKWMLK